MNILRSPAHRVGIAAAAFLAQCSTAAVLRAGEIHDAAAAGELTKVKALLAADPTLLESRDNDGETPLIKACNGVPDDNTQAAIVRFLIDQGANVNASGPGGRTPLMCVNKRQDESLDLMQRLIAKGADVNACMSYTTRKWTVFIGAAVSGNIEAARLLIQHGADINVRDIQGTPLQSVINYNRSISGNFTDDRKRYEAMAVLLVESGAKLQEFSFGNTELHLAAIRGFADLVPVLVRHGADVNAVNDHGHTPLYYAARHGHRRTAEALIAAGADKSAVVETNYGKAPQLSETLAEGEAYLWYLAPKGSPATGYAVKARNNLLIFDSAWDSESLDTGLANGCLNPQELAGQKITVLAGQDCGPEVLAWAKHMPGAKFVLGVKPKAGDELPPFRLALAHESFSLGEIQVHAIPAASRIFGKESLGYLVEADGLKIFHAGTHASRNNDSQLRRYREEIDFLKEFGPIDIAILPITGRHLTISYEPYLYLIDQLSPKAIYLIGEELVTEEPLKCLEVLKTRSVPVYYPEGGIAIGERFHFVQEQTPATSVPAGTTTANRAALSGSIGRASFQGLGDLPGGAFESICRRVSADGTVVVGNSTTSSGSQAFRWTQEEGMVSLGNLPDGGFKQSWAVGVSADGSVIVGYGDPEGPGDWAKHQAFRWTRDGGMVLLSGPDGPAREALGVSADGSVIVGDSGTQAFRWTQSDGMTALGVLPDRTSSRAIAVSADGSAVTGSSYTLPSWTNEETYLWTPAGGMEGLGGLSGHAGGFPNAISADGSVIVGSVRSGVFRWSRSTGMTGLGQFPGAKVTHPGAATNDGAIIVGASFVDRRSPGTAFIWDAGHGMRSLLSELESEYGLDLTGWHLQNASSITPDGSVIVGWGTNPSGQTEAFRVVLPARTPATPERA